VFRIVKANESHRAFIEDTFLRSVSVGWPWRMVPWPSLREDLQRRLRSPGARVGIAVLEADSQAWLGWGAVVPLDNEVIYAYTTRGYRTRPGFEILRVATTLLTGLGADLTKPTTLRYWTPSAQTLSERPGYQLRSAK
jgi:hypothetical protein